MARIRTNRRQTSGGDGGGGTPVYGRAEIVSPYTAGDVVFNVPPGSMLTGDFNSMILWFQKNFAQPDGEDWSYNALNGDVSLTFSFDPAIDYPEDGTVIIDYWYLTP